MASPSASPPVSRSCTSWDMVSSAIFVPLSASWVLLSSPLQPTRSLFVLPPFYLHLVFAPASLVLPLAALAFSRLGPDFASDSASPLPLATTLFARFRHIPSDQVVSGQFPSLLSSSFQLHSFGKGLLPSLSLFIWEGTHLARSSLSCLVLHCFALPWFVLSRPQSNSLHVSDVQTRPAIPLCLAPVPVPRGTPTSDPAVASVCPISFLTLTPRWIYFIPSRGRLMWN